MNKKFVRFYSIISVFIISVFILLLACSESYAQEVALSGVVLDSLDTPIAQATVGILEEGRGVVTDSSGYFRFNLREGQEITLVVRHASYEEFRQKVLLNKNLYLQINLSESNTNLRAVEVTSQEVNNDERQVSEIIFDPSQMEYTPTGTAEFAQLLVTLGLGITSNSELSSAYSVRGGNYEENLIYVDGIEIYRPFLVRSGQQEGLSFVNLDLVKKASFSAGGWQAKWGDKLSSVLNVDYKTPDSFAASATVGLLGGNAHIEGADSTGRFTYLAGIRHKDVRYLFNTLETDGEYLPRFSDFQSLLTWRLNKIPREGKNTTISLLTAYSQNRYRVFPSGRETTFGTFDQQLRFFVDYSGEELMNYTTYQGAIKINQQFSERFSTNWIFSGIDTREREFVDTEGAYRLCDVETNTASDNFNKCTLTRGAASEYFYARNALDAQIYTLQNRSAWRVSDKTIIEFGGQIKNENIQDNLFEYEVLDSADFVELSSRVETSANISSWRAATYAQMTHFWQKDSAFHNLTAGVRVQYWSLNGQTLVSPRLQYQYRPDWQKDIQFGIATGIYQQAPFYRELRDFEGIVNQDLRAQRSFHFISSMDWNFKFQERPFKLIVEGYYKQIQNLIPYDVDNMRLRYYANNQASGYAWGIDSRVSGEFIKGTESWVSLSYLQTRENLLFDERSFVRRPTDQRITATIFFEDHLPNNPTWRANLRLLFGSGLPFGAPNNVNFRSAFTAPAYRRVDIGFSKSLVFEEQSYIKSLWFGLEVLNIIGAENIISYQWVSDFVNDVQLAVPNGLSQRFFNLRMIAKF